jgi:hypothetical protein
MCTANPEHWKLPGATHTHTGVRGYGLQARLAGGEYSPNYACIRWQDETIALNGVVACCSSSLHSTEGAFTAYVHHTTVRGSCLR